MQYKTNARVLIAKQYFHKGLTKGFCTWWHATPLQIFSNIILFKVATQMQFIPALNTHSDNFEHSSSIDAMLYEKWNNHFQPNISINITLLYIHICLTM